MLTVLGEPYGDRRVAILQIAGKESDYPATLMQLSRIGSLVPHLRIAMNTKTAFGPASYNGQAVMKVGSCGTAPEKACRFLYRVNCSLSNTAIGETTSALCHPKSRSTKRQFSSRTDFRGDYQGRGKNPQSAISEFPTPSVVNRNPHGIEEIRATKRF